MKTMHPPTNARINMTSSSDMRHAVSVLSRRGVVLPAGRITLTSFGDSAESSALMIHLIRQGIKRAGSSLLWSYGFEGEALPLAGEHELVMSHDNEPLLLTRIVRTRILPFSAVSAEQAALEGEGDLSLAFWRAEHWRFFSQECRRIGQTPSDDMPVLFIEFELLRDLQQAGA